MTKQIKLFEAFLGDKFYAWKTDDRTAIKQTGRVISVTTKNDDFGSVVSRFDLDLIPAYTLA